MVSIEVDRLAIVFTITLHECGGLADADKFALAFRDACHDRDVQPACGISNRFEYNQIRKIEVTERPVPLAKRLERLPETWNCHVHFLSSLPTGALHFRL